MSRSGAPAPITGHTRLVGIFGDPVAHSRSPAMHNAAFAELGLNYRYVPFHVRPHQLAAATRSIRALELVGVNVTVPHKEKILRHLDSLSELAGTLGAANTVINRDGHLVGDNTDVFGFVESLRPRRRALRNRSAVVIGAGGAARAALFGLAELGVRDVLLINRTAARGRRVLDELSSHVPPARLAGLDALAAASTFDGVALVLNATSLGWGREPFPEIAIRSSKDDCMFYDMAYGTRTDFLRKAQRAHRPTMDGAEMLVFQGARSFTLWTKRRAPVAAMRVAFHKKY